MPTVQERAVVDNRYEIAELLGRGGMGVVYRARDRLGDQDVALKQVHLNGSQAVVNDTGGSESISAHVALAREFITLGRLRHPYIISVLDYGFHEQQPYFTMTLLQDPRDICEALRDQPVEEQYRVMAQMLMALAYLHRRDVVHRDLKPGNVLVDHTGRVKVVDFGLAQEREQAQATVGTLAYMAPEVLRGEGAGPASDLYAAGIIMFEVFAGRHPYAREQVTEMIRNVLNEAPNLAPLPQPLQPVLERLLAKAPEERFPSALDALRALSRALDQALPPESEEIRESFLRAATFVGREAEMRQLSQALDRALEGKGSAWLVGGESGVGKTRLLDELRIRALVKGAFTLRGQADREGGAPYQLWREVLRRLCLHAELTPLEAGVLKPLAPDMERLLGRPVADAPELDAEATQRRLLSVVEAVLKRVERPLVLILEDLQWAGAGLGLLHHLTVRLAERPVLIVASYRDDEFAELPRRLPAMQLLRLQRFGEETVEALSASMLGERAGRQQQVVSLLVRETEGNVFFLVEVIRALAEEAGSLENVGTMTLPQHVFAAGIAAIVQRRLQRVPAWGQGLLKLAAVRGRLLDPPLLQAAEPDVDFDNWVARCNDAAVLELRGDGWQFAHDKLREAVLQQLAPEDKRELHQRVAQTMEQVYAQNVLYARTLAHHWARAGERDKEVHYRTIAGRLALDNGSNREALQLLQRALSLAEWQQHERLTLAQLNRLLGEAYLGLGDLMQARAAFLQTIRHLRAPFPQNQALLGMRFVTGLGHQLLHRLRRPPAASGVRARRRSTEKMHAYRQLGEISFLVNEAFPTIYATIHALNAAERLPPGPEQAILYGNMCVVAGLIPWHGLADAYRQRAMETLQQLPEPDPWAAGNVHLALSVYVTSLGIWANAEPYCERALAEAESSGDFRLRGGGLNVLATARYNQGYYEESLELYRELHALGRDSGNRMHEGWGVVNQVACLMRMERLPRQALPMLQKSLEIQRDVQDKVAELNTHALLAVYFYRVWQPKRALEAALNALPLLSESATSLGSYEGFHDVPTVLLDLWERGVAQAEEPARDACKRLASYARIFRFARPIEAICMARLYLMDGHEAKAQSALRVAVEEARYCGMGYEEGVARGLGVGG